MSTISLRLPRSIHERIKALAERDGTSINQFLATAAAEKVAALDTEEYLEARALRGTRARFLELVRRAPDVEAVSTDQLPPSARSSPQNSVPGLLRPDEMKAADDLQDLMRQPRDPLLSDKKPSERGRRKKR